MVGMEDVPTAGRTRGPALLLKAGMSAPGTAVRPVPGAAGIDDKAPFRARPDVGNRVAIGPPQLGVGLNLAVTPHANLYEESLQMPIEKSSKRGATTATPALSDLLKRP
jgi:hypothetical protein